MDNVISVEKLEKRYGDTVAVSDVSLSVERNEIVGLLGPNGAGKTTTVECLQGLRRRDGGAVSVLGLDPDVDGRLLLPRIGSQLQSSALPNRLRVGEAIRLFAATKSTPTDVEGVLARWDLTSLRNRPFGALSGGQRQRLFLALALLGEPEIVFLDELTTGLDPQARRATWDLVLEVRDRGATVVLVTHFMEEAETLCDRVAIINDGRVVAVDTPTGLVAASSEPIRMTFTAANGSFRHLGSIPGVNSVSSDGTTTTVFGDARSPVLVAAELARNGAVPTDFRTLYPTLEDVFLSQTGRSLRD